MSSLLRPVGHLPASVYWVRRVLVLVVLAALVFVLFRVFGGDDEAPANTAATGTDQSPAPGTSSPSTSVTPSGTASTSISTASDPSRSPSPGQSEPAEDAKCGGKDVRISVAPSSRAIVPGGILNLTVRLSAVRGECTATIDPTKLILTISSGKDRIWTTSHCRQSIPQATLILAEGKDSISTVPWDGRRSGPGCPPGRPAAKPGTYVVQAVFDWQASTPQAFRIT
jgi:hypothetical protein